MPFAPSEGELSISCGCTGAPRLAIVRPGRSLDVAGPTCGSEESFSIASDSLHDTEGCYFDTAEFNNDSPVYTASGTLGLSQIWVVAAEYTDEKGDVSVSEIFKCGVSHTGRSDWSTGHMWQLIIVGRLSSVNVTVVEDIRSGRVGYC